MTSPDSSRGSDSSTGVIYTPAYSASPLSPSPLPPPPPPPPPAPHPSTLRDDQDPLFAIEDPDQGPAHNPPDSPNSPDMSGRPPFHRPTDGLSHSSDPLLQDQKDTSHRGRHSRTQSYSSQTASDFNTRRATFRSRSPKLPTPADQARKRYLYASFFLLVSLVSFVVQTETSVYIQHTLHWNKAYCMLWFTHGSWVVLWPTQLLILRIAKRKITWPAFWRRHKQQITTTAQMVEHQDLHLSASTTALPPWRYMLKTTAGVTSFLTVAGASWYIAVDLTTPSDLTAIYNCSAFFAYVFSILLLGDKVRIDKVISVALAIIGVLIVAYGDDGNPKHGSHSGGSTNPNPEEPADNRALGNLIIGVGSVMYGLYEVLYKKYACPPEGTSPGRGMIFANTFGSMIGTFTLCVLWIPLPILHFLNIERFELPRGQAAWLLGISTLSNATFSGAFLVLMSLTSPVLSSVAALLTIFLVALTDYFLTGEPLSTATIAGGTLIIVAFGLLSWATWREMVEEERHKQEIEGKSFDVDEAMEQDRLVGDQDSDADDGDELGRGPGRMSN